MYQFILGIAIKFADEKDDENYYKMVEMLVDQDNRNRSMNVCSFTPMHYAAYLGNLRIVKTLIKLCDSKDLFEATHEGETSPFFYILDCYISPSANKPHVRFELARLMAKHAGPYGPQAITREIDKDLRTYSPLSMAICKEDIQFIEGVAPYVKLVIDPDNPYNIYQVEGTFMHYAIENDKLDALKVLLKYSETKNPADQEGNTLVHQAVWFNVPDFVEYLIKIVDDWNSPNEEGITPLAMAKDEGYMKIAGILELAIKTRKRENSDSSIASKKMKMK